MREEPENRALIVLERYDLTVPERALIERGLLLADSLEKKKYIFSIGRTDTWLGHATALKKLEDWRGLLDLCLNWTKSEPDNYEAWLNLGFAYEKLNRYDDAAEAYQKATRINPENADSWSALGRNYGKLKRHDDAIKAYRQALRINPDYAPAWLSLGYVYEQLKCYNDAIETYRKAGNAYSNLHRYEDAIEAYRDAIRINPEYVDAWFALGLTYGLSGNRTEALKAVRELRRLDQASADTLLNLIEPR